GIDFFSYYMAARVPMTGHSPYEHGHIDYEHPVFHDAAVEHFRWWGVTGKIPEGLKQPIALPYPPQAYLIFLPFARLPWNVALASWIVFLTALAIPCGTLSWSFDAARRRSAFTDACVVAVFLLNPLTHLLLGLGQSTLILCSSIALGQWAFRRGYYWAGGLAWSFCAIKPHLGFAQVLLW